MCLMLCCLLTKSGAGCVFHHILTLIWTPDVLAITLFGNRNGIIQELWTLYIGCKPSNKKICGYGIRLQSMEWERARTRNELCDGKTMWNRRTDRPSVVLSCCVCARQSKYNNQHVKLWFIHNIDLLMSHRLS